MTYEDDVLDGKFNPANKPDPRLQRLREMVDRQAEDEGLWFIAQYITEAYLQQELRKLHALIEELTDE